MWGLSLGLLPDFLRSRQGLPRRPAHFTAPAAARESRQLHTAGSGCRFV